MLLLGMDKRELIDDILKFYPPVTEEELKSLSITELVIFKVQLELSALNNTASVQRY